MLPFLSFKKFPTVLQYDEMDCGPNALKIICQHYGKDFSLPYLRDKCNTTKEGSSLLDIMYAAKSLHFEAEGIELEIDDLSNDMLPCIAYWNQKHFVVIYKVTKSHVYISDPAVGLIKYNIPTFLSFWKFNGDKGVLLTLKPKPEFFEQKLEKNPEAKGIATLFKEYFFDNKLAVIQVFAVLVLLGFVQLAFPTITENLVDKGILGKNLSYIYILLLAQFAFFIGRLFGELLNTYALLKLGNRMNIKLMSRFLEKLFNLPLHYFDVKMSGDILQRLSDLSRIEHFITNSVLYVLYSCISFLMFGSILLFKSWKIFIIFLVGSFIYFLWFRYFMRKRAVLDYVNFSKLSERSEKNIEMIYGMTEIKLNNAGEKKKTEWKNLQHNLFEIGQKTLYLSQWQNKGAATINEIKNICITFFAAYMVVHDQLTLGVLFSISYIVGNLNEPVRNFLEFLQQLQDAQLSANRVNEVFEQKNENNIAASNPIDGNKEIAVQNLYFNYKANKSNSFILKNISFTIPNKKVTAIVGHSGCGKSTLLKLLLKFYEPTNGTISLGSSDFTQLSHDSWRNSCGTVMQESYIFSDTIENNIALSDTVVSEERLQNAIQIAGLNPVIEKYPLGSKTKIGNNGFQLSGGEKQRVLIARAIYKNPEYLFFDEATSNLDALNESEIVKNLNTFFKGRTVCIIAHRFSTIKNADQIIVMHHGEIVEIGTHNYLLHINGYYKKLIENQVV